MATEIIFPKIGFSMTEGILAEWMVEDGAAVAEGQVLYSVETDKSTNEVEAPASGVVRIVGQTGETYEVGAIIGSIE
jgi:pyruvate/2-oxoglutarate dehydrogenase complex dihydrolipoamide acyltransferase (E2) component